MLKHVYLLIAGTLLLGHSSTAQISAIASTTSGCAPVSVNFSVSGAPGGSQFFWYFSDGGFSTLANPTHVFATAGDHSAFVDVYDASFIYLGSDFVNLQFGGQPDTFYVNRDTACIGDEISMYINNGIQYDSYTINYGDGSPIQTNTWGDFYHTYTANGVYNIVLTVSDACGTFQVNNTVVIKNNYPILDGVLQVSANQVCPGNQVDVWTNWYYDYIFNYGDGSAPTTDDRHTYTQLGTYTITVYLQNGCGLSTAVTDQIQVLNNLPIDPQNAYVNSYPDPQCPGSDVSYSVPSGYSVYEWDFGDGGTSTLQYPSHAYDLPGTYGYSVYIVNGCGFDTTMYNTVVIDQSLPMNYAEVNAPDSVCPGELFHISGSPEDALSLAWNFGDGNTGSGEELLHSYASNGIYTITLTATNGCGNSLQANHQVVVNPNTVPDLNDYFMDIFPQEACPGDTLLFLSGPGGGGGATYRWEYGDGTDNTGETASPLTMFGLTFDVYKHAYSTAGVYTVTGTVTNSCGNSTSRTFDISVGAGAVPEAGFLFDADRYNCLGEPVLFQAAGGNQYQWDFGDGSGILTTTGTLEEVYHAFTEPGTYNITVTVTNGCGLQDAETSELFIPDSRVDIVTNTLSANCGVNNGIAVASVSGLNAPYTLMWTNGDQGAIADSLSSGIYQVNIVDKEGCENFAIATVSDIEAPTIVVSAVVDVSCFGGENGAIDINLIGSSAPYSYTWSNGKFSEDINNLEAGPYEIIVEDASGCIATKSILVEQPEPTYVTVAKLDANCGQNNGQATIQVSGSNAPYSFVWQNGNTNQTVYGLGHGVYNATVIDANGCLYPTSVDISETGGPVIRVDSIINPGCGNGVNSIYITPIGGQAPYSYNWSAGASTQDLVGVGTGTYIVRVTGANSCRSVKSFSLDFEEPESQDICMVTVDPVSQRNVIVWDKPAVQGNVASYNIYKESSQSGLYFLVGNTPYDSLSSFVDYSADPSIRSWRYKITAVDSCGNESEYSPIHKTIHLTNNMGISGEVNLIWDYYSGMNYSTINLWRYSSVDGWNLIQAMPSNLTSYTDATPPSGASSLAYIIEAIPDNPCTATRAVNHNTTRSNRTSAIQGPVSGINDISAETWMNVFPNPASDQVQVSFMAGEYAEHVDLMMYDINGKLVFAAQQDNVFGQGMFRVPAAEFAGGLYMVVIQSGTSAMHQRLLIHK
jgi:PKD repeat protein